MAIRIGRIDELSLTQETKQNSLLAAIAKSAEELTSGKGWPNGVIDLMADLGRITRVSRVWIFQVIEINDDYIIQDYPFEWADSAGHAQLSMPKFNTFRREVKNASPEYKQMLESRKRGEWQSVIVSQLDAGEFRENLEGQGILSMLTIPIIVEGKWWGILGFDDCKREYHWSEVEIALLRTATYLLSNAILRDRLSSKTKQFEILKGITDASTWELDLVSGHFWCSPEVFASQNGLTENIHMSQIRALRRIHPQDRKNVFASIREHIREGKNTFRKDLRVARDCGEYVWIEIIAQLSTNEKHELRKLSGIAVEILKRKQEEEKLRQKANKDPLTGVDNRRSFDRHFAKLMYRYKESHEIFTLLLLDLDHFKNVNDTWGHAMGDEVLRHITRICKRNLRESDQLARIGGEEFAILLSGIDENMARTIGERIRMDVESHPMQTKNGPIRMTLSLGAAGLERDSGSNSCEQLYQQADSALYAAKNKGRNALVACHDMDAAGERSTYEWIQPSWS